MRVSSPSHSRRRFWRVIVVLAGVIALQVLVAISSIDLLSAVRAYVGGESLYSKGQKDAQVHLLNYADFQREEDYRRFLDALALPIGDRAAREALQRPKPDLRAAREAFLAGGNHRDDIDDLIYLFHWFHWVPFMADAIATWTEGDRLVEQMRLLAERARSGIQAGTFDAAAHQALRAEALALNHQLTDLERRFSEQLGAASRLTKRLLLGLNLGLAGVLLLIGVRFVRRSHRDQLLAEVQLRKREDERRAREALEASNRAKSQFLSRMSHELRTPLNAVLGFAQLMRTDRRRPLDPDHLARVQHIEHAGEHLLALVNDVLDLSRVESGEMTLALEPVDVRQVAAEAVAFVSQMAADAGIEIRNALPGDVEADDAWVLADPVRLRQVLVNLLSNAVKYNRQRGRVTLRLQRRDGLCRLSVLDTGVGMSPEQLARLYEPFNRLGAERSRIEGTGIGLMLCKHMVELMHGTLAIDSMPGRGTVASVELQGSDVPGEAVPSAYMPSQHGAFDGALNVLYAEDNEVNVELVRQVAALRPAVILRVAPNGQVALEMARQDPPDLMLVDMHLGDMTGMELARALRRDRATADIPLVALSADALPEQIDAALEWGFEGYLTKPIDFRELLRVLDGHAIA
jgi:signal transduction histidine kinase